MSKPEVWSMDMLLEADLGRTEIWVSPSVRTRVEKRFPYPVTESPERLSDNLDALICIGGGALIDEAKVWRVEHKPQIRLVAIPSIWGSGAENSPIAVLNRHGKKVIKMGNEFLPDVRVVWNDLSSTLPFDRVRHACGDVWAHVLEGFLSPLAENNVREGLANIIKTLLQTAVGNDPVWFELSGRACSAQAKASVGLVHGIAHQLEGPLKLKFRESNFGHAQLCATYLWPVMSLNRQVTNQVESKMRQFNLDEDRINSEIKAFFDVDLYGLALPTLEENWKLILRDPSTRTNCGLVRLDHLSHFTEMRFA